MSGAGCLRAVALAQIDVLLQSHGGYNESSLTKAVRFELRAQGTVVVGVYADYIDTDMAVHMWGAEEFSKSSPAEIATRVLAGIEDGTEEILTDERAHAVHSALLKDARPFDSELQEAWDVYASQRQ